jgi:hypothetical protein
VEEQKQQLDGYAVVEVLGHNTFAGKISEHAIGGSALLRIDIPEVPEKKIPYTDYDYSNGKCVPVQRVRTLAARPAFTKLIGIGSIYALTPCTEEVARRVAEEGRKQPIDMVSMPAIERMALTAGDAEIEDDTDDQDEPVF